MSAQEPPTSDDPAGQEPLSLAGDSFAPDGQGLRAGPLQLRSLLQLRYSRTFAADSGNPRIWYHAAENMLARDGDGASLQRFFIRLAIRPLEYLELKTIVDVAELVHDNVDSAIKQAYVTLEPWLDHIAITAGLLKLPYSVLELDPVAAYPFADLGEADVLTKNLGFAGRDIGAELTLSPLSKPKALRVAFGAFRGEASDEVPAVIGTLGARVEARPFKGLRIGGDWVEHPAAIVHRRAFDTSNKDVLPHPLDPQYPRAQSWARGRAFSADVRYRRHHLLLEVEGMFGDRIDLDTRYSARTFFAVWGMAGVRFKIGSVRLLPVVRVGWLDANRETPVGAERELSLGLNLDFAHGIRLLFDVTRLDVDAMTPRLDQPKPLLDPPYNQLPQTRVIGQLQITL